MSKRKLSEVEVETVYCTGVYTSEAGAGIGIWFEQGDERNVAYKCPGAQSEQRAQLIAVIMAVMAADEKEIVVRTSSEYVQQSIERYYPVWVQSGIVGHVENHLVIQCLLTLLDGMWQAGKTIRFECILTGAGPQGAQELAFRGSTFTKEEDWDWETVIAGYKQVFASERHIGESSKRAKIVTLSDASEQMTLDEKNCDTTAVVMDA
ncbi:hypothetical protein EYR40_010936 [Pleurotus pulmonarius]|nr:hypothetical protein EYR36_002703 [Pleurotus pulmonarius]KAF4586919.1 hypothetical protein EYR40_010936 [Pleurotus pulmonarius]